MQRSSRRPNRRSHTTRREKEAAASRELQFAVRAAEPDQYPIPLEDLRDRGACPVLPFGGLDWLFVSVLLVIDRTTLLVRLEDPHAPEPKIWIVPTDRHNRSCDLRECAVRTLHSTTGIELPPRRLRLLDDCVVSLAHFGGETRHAFFIAQLSQAA